MWLAKLYVASTTVPKMTKYSTIMYIYIENFCLKEQTRISEINHYGPKHDQSSTVIHIYSIITLEGSNKYIHDFSTIINITKCLRCTQQVYI